MRMNRLLQLTLVVAATLLTRPLPAQESGGSRILRGSLVEDKAARKLIDAGDARYEVDETNKAVEIWQSVVERYPRSRLRYEAHMRLGNFFLDKERAHDRARAQFEAIAAEENRDEDQRAEATLKIGSCFYHARNYGKCFQVMRDVIQKFPVSKHVNEAYYYIGLGHFQLGHYSRAIAALEKVGTTVSGNDSHLEKVEAGKRLFVKIEDADLAVLERGEAVDVLVQVEGGDSETIKCFPVGRNVRIVLGSIPTQLGTPKPGNGSLEVKGDDKVKVTYIDRHTADRKFDQEVSYEVSVVGDGVVAITDGAFSESLGGVVLGKSVNVQITDADRDLSPAAESIKAVVEVFRRKTDEELETEAAEAVQAAAAGNATADSIQLDEDGQPKIDKYKQIDRVEVTLTEARIVRRTSAQPPFGSDAEGENGTPDDKAATGKSATKNPAVTTEPQAGAKAPLQPEDNAIHSGVFRVIIPLAKTEQVTKGDATLQAISGDLVRVTYLDERHSGEGISQLQAEARCIEGDLSGVRVTRAEIGDRELKIKTSLKSANALTNIGNRYKEFGLKSNADVKYKQALQICEETMKESRALGGKLLEQTYVQLWQVYFEMDRLELAAAMAQRLQREFPNSGFVDDALLQLADVARKQGNLRRAVGIYTRLVNMDKSQLRGEAQFGIAQCYELMAEAAPETRAPQLYDRAFLEYQKVYEQFSDSGRVGEAVAKMANYYYRQKDYGRAIDTFETVLANHPDAKFLDVILFNYGRCLYRMNRRPEARRRFDQLIGDYPESPLAADAKKISDALAKSSG